MFNLYIFYLDIIQHKNIFEELFYEELVPIILIHNFFQKMII